MSHKIDVRVKVRHPGIPEKTGIEKSLGAVLDALQKSEKVEGPYEIHLTVTGDPEIRKLNRQHRQKDKATDVLSFPLHEPESEFPAPEGFTAMGDVVISADMCKVQAADVGHSVEDEFYRLLVHGVLHLFGYDHEISKKDAAKMRKKEDELLALI